MSLRKLDQSIGGRRTQYWQPVPTVLCSTESVGRPRFEISKDQLEYFVEDELVCPDIAEALGVSASAIKRRTV